MRFSWPQNVSSIFLKKYDFRLFSPSFGTKILFYAAYLGLSMSFPNHASASERNVAYGLGIQSCSVFASQYAANPGTTEAAYYLWAEGFLSGLNLIAGVDNQPMHSIDGTAQAMSEYKSEIRHFCKNNPLSPFYEGVMKIWLNLPVRAK